MTGILVACWVPGETGRAIALASGEPVDQMHVTLVYLKDAPKEQIPDVVRAVAPVAMSSAALTGEVSGRGRFYGDEQDVIYAVPSVPGLAELRERLRAQLAASGFPDPSEHGWNPHITLKYVSTDEPTPFSEYSDSDRERLMSFVKKEGDCWMWQGAKTEKGYGAFKAGGVTQRAHRVAYQMFNGPIEDGMQLLHATKDGCKGTSCINPKHLRPGSNDENVADRYAAEERTVPLEFGAIEVRYGDEYRVELPFGLPAEEDDDEAFDMSEVNDIPDWTAETAWQFMEWFGYTIEPDGNSSLGYAVTSPSGKRLGGFVAKQIIDASMKTPDTGAGGKGGKKKGKGGSGGKKAAVDPVTALAEAKGKAEEAIGKVDAIGMEDKSGGVLKADDIQKFVDAAKEKLQGVTDPKEAAKIITAMKKEIANYKNELMPKPTAQVAREQAVSKIAKALPSVNELAGDKFDPAAIKSITDKYDIAGARSPEKARELVKQMRTEVADYKKQATAQKAQAKTEAAEIKSQAKDFVSLQTAAQQKGWETAEVIKGSPADMKAYQDKVVELAKNNPDKTYTVVKAGDGTFGLLVKPNNAIGATRSAEPAKAGNLLGGIPEPAKVKKPKAEPVTASEWAEYYVERLVADDPEQFGHSVAGQPRAADGKWTLGGGLGKSLSVDKMVDGVERTAEHKLFRTSYLGTDASFRVNAHLRNGGGDAKTAASAAKLVKAADKASVALPNAVGVQRLIHFKNGVPADFKKGAVISDKGFTSTTADKKIADYHQSRLSKRVKADGGALATLNITLPAGTKVIPSRSEAELVLKPPSRYKITGKSGNTFTAELIP